MIDILEKNKFLNALGLAYRARKISIGIDVICNNIKNGKTKLVIISNEASNNTKKKINNCVSYYNIPIDELNISMKELGSCIGKSDIACIAILDESFVKLIKKYIM